MVFDKLVVSYQPVTMAVNCFHIVMVICGYQFISSLRTEVRSLKRTKIIFWRPVVTSNSLETKFRVEGNFAANALKIRIQVGFERLIILTLRTNARSRRRRKSFVSPPIIAIIDRGRKRQILRSACVIKFWRTIHLQIRRFSAQKHSPLCCHFHRWQLVRRFSFGHLLNLLPSIFRGRRR